MSVVVLKKHTCRESCVRQVPYFLQKSAVPEKVFTWWDRLCATGADGFRKSTLRGGGSGPPGCRGRPTRRQVARCLIWPLSGARCARIRSHPVPVEPGCPQGKSTVPHCMGPNFSAHPKQASGQSAFSKPGWSPGREDNRLQICRVAASSKPAFLQTHPAAFSSQRCM